VRAEQCRDSQRECAAQTDVTACGSLVTLEEPSPAWKGPVFADSVSGSCPAAPNLPGPGTPGFPAYHGAALPGPVQSGPPGAAPPPPLVPCGPPSGPAFVNSPSSGASTPGPGCTGLPAPVSGSGPGPMNNCGPNSFLPPNSNCGPMSGQGPMAGPQFGPGPPQFNGLGPCGPGMPASPSNCGPPSHFRGQSPPGRPGSSGPPFPFGPGPNGPCGPSGGPPCGPPGPHGPPHQFLGPGPPGPHNFGPHGPGFGPHGPMGPHGPLHGPPPHFMDRRPMPMLQPDYKIFEMNKRLQQRTDDSDNLWWDAFANEFFEDEAQLTLTFCLEDGPKRYSKNFFYFLFRSQETETRFAAVGRTLIPRFFRSIFEGGVTDLHWELRHAKESFHQAVVSLDCDQATMVTQHGKPMFTKVYTEGRLIVEFNFDDLMRIRSWHFAIRNHRELIPRSVIAMQEPGMVETLSKNITRQGLTATTLNYLRVSSEVTGRIEPLESAAVAAGATGPDPDSLPLPSAQTLTGQSMTAPTPTSASDNMPDFASESFQFQ